MIHISKTKALISFAITAKLICVFVFAYTKSRFSHDEAHLSDFFKYKTHLNIKSKQSCLSNFYVRKKKVQGTTCTMYMYHHDN